MRSVKYAMIYGAAPQFRWQSHWKPRAWKPFLPAWPHTLKVRSRLD